MELQIENLKALIKGVELIPYQRALALQEWNNLLGYVKDLEQLNTPRVSQRSELLAFMNFLFENWQPRKHLTADMLVDAYLKANCG